MDRENYYEAHITFEPVYEDDGARVELLDRLVGEHGFRRAKLLMQKRASDTPERSAQDSFCTGRSYSEAGLRKATYALVVDLLEAGFAVWRYKVEYTVCDSMYNPALLPIATCTLPDKYRSPRAPV